MVLAALVIGIILIVVGGIINAISYEGGYVYQVVGGFLLGSAVIDNPPYYDAIFIVVKDPTDYSKGMYQYRIKEWKK